MYYVNIQEKYVLPLFQIIDYFSFSRYIVFAMYLDIVYIFFERNLDIVYINVHNKKYGSRKVKMTYNLERKE